MRKQLHWVAVQPTPYNDYLFRSLAGDPAVDLTVHFTRSSLGTHPWQSSLGKGFPSRSSPRARGVDTALLRLAVRSKDAFFIVAGWNDPTKVALLETLVALRRPFAIWTDTPNLYRHRPTVKAVVRAKFLAHCFRHAHAVMGTGRPAMSALLKMGCPESKLVNFPFVVDLDAYCPEDQIPGCAEVGNPVFLSSGQLLNSHKAYDLAIRALATLSTYPEMQQFRYCIAGVGPDRECLEALARASGILDHVEFVGWLEPSQLRMLYRSGQIFLHPSNFDPYPNAVLEAMASGLLVIGSDAAGSVADRIVNGVNGLAHRSGDLADLVAKILYALREPEQVRSMRSKARETMSEWPVHEAISVVRQVIQG
jgi:glycosyltransferase involved in cell wall biosynthesis